MPFEYAPASGPPARPRSLTALPPALAALTAELRAAVGTGHLAPRAATAAVEQLAKAARQAQAPAPDTVVSAGVEVRNVAGLSYTTSSAFIFPSRGCSWASNSLLAALVSPRPLVHLKAARWCRSKVALTTVSLAVHLVAARAILLEADASPALPRALTDALALVHQLRAAPRSPTS